MTDIIFWKPNDFRETLYFRAFVIADYEFDLGFPFFEMADPSNMGFWKLCDFCTTLYSGVLKVADYEFQIGCLAFNIADRIWQR